MTLQQLRRRVGKSHWEAHDEVIFALPGLCAQSSVFIRFRPSAAKAKRVSVYWSLGDESCVAKSNPRFSAHSKPFKGVPCSRFAERCATSALNRATEKRLVEGLGFPHHVEGATWQYAYPRGCSEERGRLTITMRAGRVERARWQQASTGEICR